MDKVYWIKKKNFNILKAHLPKLNRKKKHDWRYYLKFWYVIAQTGDGTGENNKEKTVKK